MCLSFVRIVTHLAWMAAKSVSSKINTRYASLAFCRALIMADSYRRSTLHGNISMKVYMKKEPQLTSVAVQFHGRAAGQVAAHKELCGFLKTSNF